MKYGWNLYFEPTPKNVSKWLLFWKVVFVAASGSAYAAHSPALGFWMMVGTVVLGELGNMFAEPPGVEVTIEETQERINEGQ